MSWGGACLLAAMTLVLPLELVLAMLLAAGFHELCHIAALYALGSRLASGSVYAGGALLRADDLSGIRLCAATLAGPLGELSLLLFIRLWPALALCAAAQSAFNLMPVLPLDGGRVLQCIMQAICPRNADRTTKIVGCVWMLGLWSAAVYASWILKAGYLPVCITAFLNMKVLMSYRK